MQADQTARAVKEQARTMREMIAAAQNTAKQIKLITNANLEHSTVSGSLLRSVAEIRQITDRNASGVKQTRGGTDDLLRRAQASGRARRAAGPRASERARQPPERPCAAG